MSSFSENGCGFCGPLFTIITPSYNQGNFIGRTIDSVLGQTYKNFEYIVVDGLSTDGTREVLNSYEERGIRIICESDTGQSNAINKGMRLATGKYVGWINSDDLLRPNCLEVLAGVLSKVESGVDDPAIVYSPMIDFIGEMDEVTGQAMYDIRSAADLLQNNFSIIQQGSFYRRDLLESIGYIDEDLNYCMDLDLWLRLLERGGIVSTQGKAIAAFRRWGPTKTNTGGPYFMREIRQTLLKHGATLQSSSLRRALWWEAKQWVKIGLSKLSIPIR